MADQHKTFTHPTWYFVYFVHPIGLDSQPLDQQAYKLFVFVLDNATEAGPLIVKMPCCRANALLLFISPFNIGNGD